MSKVVRRNRAGVSPRHVETAVVRSLSRTIDQIIEEERCESHIKTRQKWCVQCMRVDVLLKAQGKFVSKHTVMMVDLSTN